MEEEQKKRKEINQSSIDHALRLVSRRWFGRGATVSARLFLSSLVRLGVVWAASVSLISSWEGRRKKSRQVRETKKNQENKKTRYCSKQAVSPSYIADSHSRYLLCSRLHCCKIQNTNILCLCKQAKPCQGGPRQVDKKRLSSSVGVSSVSDKCEYVPFQILYVFPHTKYKRYFPAATVPPPVEG